MARAQRSRWCPEPCGSVWPRCCWSAVSALADRTSILTRVPLTKPPAVLLDRGEELRRSLGYPEAPVDLASGFTYDQSYLNWNRRNAKGDARWRALSEGTPGGPGVLDSHQSRADGGVEDAQHPRRDRSAARHRRHDAHDARHEGTARGVCGGAVAARVEGARPRSPWTGRRSLRRPVWTWERSRRRRPRARRRHLPTIVAPGRARCRRRRSPVTIEAASFRGKPVSFEIVGPWSPAPREPGDDGDDSNGFASPVLILVLLVSAVVLARQNLQVGPGGSPRRVPARGRVVLYLCGVLAAPAASVQSRPGDEPAVHVPGPRPVRGWRDVSGVSRDRAVRPPKLADDAGGMVARARRTPARSRDRTRPADWRRQRTAVVGGRSAWRAGARAHGFVTGGDADEARDRHPRAQPVSSC